MKTPVHLWIVAIVSLLWNAFGAFDYVMTQTGNQDYLAMLTEPQRAFLDGVPVWFDAAWATGVWFSMVGSLLLLFRSRFAALAFLISLAGLVVSAIYSFGIASPSSFEISGAFALGLSALICVVLILLWRYAKAMTRRGVLR